ncbi:hypothetical protein WME76_40275 [Sorangium sp. So ce119]|uniref:hypothetical protein n=1 Tax=Sorangium sp. So ce119 TaxID=3133279 RepID=UPI003F6002FF
MKRVDRYRVDACKEVIVPPRIRLLAPATNVVEAAAPRAGVRRVVEALPGGLPDP